MPKRVLQGVVLSDKNSKTRVVESKRTFLHPLLKKTVRTSKKYHVHDEQNQCKQGEKIVFQECAPKSKLKKWEFIRKLDT